jgi:hypothetical protein
MSADHDNDDDTDSEVLDFDHIQRLDGSRFLKIHTEQTTFLLQIHGDDLDDLRERLDEPPTVL